MSVITAAGFGGSSIPAILIGTVQDLAYNAAGGANAVSAAFGSNTELIEVAARVLGGGVRIAVGANPDVSTGGPYKLLPGSGSWFFIVHPGWKIAAISDDGNTGIINICEAMGLG